MSWRFRKTFKVLPGIKLNLTARGLSATLGSAPFSINVGPDGVYRNISIPGTGIWDRQRIDAPFGHEHITPGSHKPAPAATPVAVEIHSASTETLTSEGLGPLRKLLTEAYEERTELQQELSSASLDATTANLRYEGWRNGFLLRQVFKKAYERRKESAEITTAKRDELQEQLRLTAIATEIDIDKQQAEPYFRMRDLFARLTESKSIWNVLSETTINRVVQRSSADTAIDRTPVEFSLSSCDLIQWEDQRVPYLPNRTGGDMYIYPGFVLYRASKQAFALIESRDVSVRFVPTRFTEEAQVPSDSAVIGHTWAKCNKDGSPDRRFANNYQIPLVQYGSLLFTTNDGLDVRYLCSHPQSAQAFVTAWNVFHLCFSDPDAGTAVSSTFTVAEALIPNQGYFETFSAVWKNISDTMTAATGNAPVGTKAQMSFDKDMLVKYGQTFRDVLDAHRRLVDAATPEFVKHGHLIPSVPAAFRREITVVSMVLDQYMQALEQKELTGDHLLALINSSGTYFEHTKTLIEAFTEAVERVSHR